MGKLMITGKAEREVCYDIVELTVTFYNDDKNSSDAIDTVIRQSEKFLVNNHIKRRRHQQDTNGRRFT